MRVLLHSCCAPCTTFPLAFLRSVGHSVDGLFLNPNIHPQEELEKRWQTLRDFAEVEKMSLRRVDFGHEEWRSAVLGDLRKPGRCLRCYRLRLDETARIAEEEGYDCFTTSLLLSIYQDHMGIVLEARRAAAKHSVEFLYHDFRTGYRRSREMARGRHLYMQKYCGCEFSLEGEVE